MEKKFITDKQGNKVLPITHIDAVRDDDGNTIASLMGELQDYVDDQVHTPHENYVTIEASSSTTTANLDTLIDTQADSDKQKTDTIYRVSNWDGSQYDVTVYSEYSWLPSSSKYGFLCKKSQIGEVFDISEYHSGATYADLNAALTSNTGGVPSSLQKGGMSVKFVQSSDNKYVQYFLTKDEWSASAGDWEKMNLEDEVSQLGQEVDDFIQPAKEDFAISDENRNAVLIINKGEIKTKNFDSAKAPNIGDNNKTDLDVTDEEDNIIVRFADGHIKTKYFNSKDFAGTLLNGKKIVFIGDSITYGQGLTDRATEVYHAQLAQKTGCINNNQGVSGTGLCTNMTNGLSSSRFITRATSATLSNADIIVVFGGTNDFTYDSKAIGSYYNEQTITPSGRIGNKEKVAPVDTDTFSGALHELITHIRGISDAPIIFITPLHRANYATDRPNSWQVNVNGNYLSDYIDAIKSICADYSVPVLDLYSCYNLDFNDTSMRDAFSVDGIHPNKAGHTIICELLYKFIINNINI